MTRLLIGVLGSFWLGMEGYASTVAAVQRREAVLEAVVIAEAGGESYAGQVAVAEVLRNRGWSPRGFAGLRGKSVPQFLAQQPHPLRREARQALGAARAGSQLTGGATHFENLEAFGRPPWADEMEPTVTIGHHTFFRERAKA